MSEDGLRIWRSPYIDFYKDETLHVAEVYTPQYLSELAEAGFNGIWIRGILRDIAPTKVFPELGRKSAAHLRNLRTVIRRAERVGIRVWLYMQPPLALPAEASFWQRHPEAKGVTRPGILDGQMMTVMCISEPKVREFLREAAETLSRRLPGLNGAILITASEFFQHCYTHYSPELAKKGIPLGCSRCERRQPRDIIADIIRSIYSGFQRAGNGAKVIAWNWSWNAYEPDPQEEITRALPPQVALLAGFERGDTKVILGKRRTIDEYSLSFAGPSERFLKSLRVARQRGMKVMAKLQLGTTHELATVPNLPLIGTLYEKARAMRRLRVRSFMGCWNFGNMLTANTAAFVHFMDVRRLPPRRQALRAFAASYFPGCDANGVAEAWETFAEAMDSYPYCTPFLYWGPLNYALAHPIEPGPLRKEPVGRSWMPDERGDELEASFGPYTLSEIIQGLCALTRTWEHAVELLERALAGCEATTARQELDTARVAGHCFHSGWNLYRAYRLRKQWSPSKLDALLSIVRDEQAHLAQVLPIVAADRRMGFHSECQHYMFTASAIRRKLRRLAELVRS